MTPDQHEIDRITLNHEAIITWRSFPFCWANVWRGHHEAVVSPHKGSVVWGFNESLKKSFNELMYWVIATYIWYPEYTRPQYNRKSIVFGSKCIVLSCKYWFFRLAGSVCGEFTGHWWLPTQGTSNVEHWCFLICLPKHTVEQTAKLPVNVSARAIMKCCHCEG